MKEKQVFQNSKLNVSIDKSVSLPVTNGYGNLRVVSLKDSPKYFIVLDDTMCNNMFSHVHEVSERFALTWFTEFGDEV